MKSHQSIATSVTATEALGEQLGAAMGEQLVVGLEGPLGAGKTAFARGFVRGVEPELADWVASPTYAVVNAYPTSPTVHHLDLYRLEHVDDLESVGFWELLEDGGLLVEWPERIAEVSRALDLLVRIETLSPEERRIEVTALTPRGERVLADAGL